MKRTAFTTIHRVTLAAAATLLFGASAQAAPSQTPEPAVWVSHALIVDLHDLHRRYSCDDLWYKFRAVLLTLGARPDMSIAAYRCERKLSAATYSPQVELRFWTPRQVDAKDARWADLRAVPTSIRLEPGAPARLDVDDCALLDQIKSTLLPYLGDAVGEFSLACQAPRSSNPHFGVTVTALIPVSNSLSKVASASPAQGGAPTRSGS
jgi:hypothetical protein